jgi:hypothetical protein
MSIPEEYSNAIRLQQAGRFNENDIKSFVYHVFGLYDKHEDVNQFLPLLADQGLEMRFPNWEPVCSPSDFQKWYRWIGENFQAPSLHQVEAPINVEFLGNGKYEVNMVVRWQAVNKGSGFTDLRGHQTWTLDDGDQGAWPRILRYIVELVP